MLTCEQKDPESITKIEILFEYCTSIVRWNQMPYYSNEHSTFCNICKP